MHIRKEFKKLKLYYKINLKLKEEAIEKKVYGRKIISFELFPIKK